MEEMPSLNMPVQRLKIAILPLDLPCSRPAPHSGEILTTGKSHGKKPDRFSLSTIKIEINSQATVYENSRYLFIHYITNNIRIYK